MEIKNNICQTNPGPSSFKSTDSEDVGATYSWSKLNVFAEKKTIYGKTKSEVQILKDVSGICRKGDLLAILGSSGAGKTTLLNVLTYRSTKLKINGDIRLNGEKVDPDTLMGISAYVQQVDLFSRVFTVREQLHFNAQLRIGKEVSVVERHRRINQVIKDLNLTKCADTLIGEVGRLKGISGGEKKRLAFGCELITNPLLLLCDEPTSGIDSFMSLSVVNVMKEMTRRGKTVISTIHQPSSEIFHMFDHIQILAEGRVAFSGTRDEAHAFFNRISRPCPQNFNPADHFIHTLAVRPGKEHQDRTYIHEICDGFRDNEGLVLQKMIDDTAVDSSAVNGRRTFSKSPYRASYKNQFLALMRRSVYEVVREPYISVIKTLQTMFFAMVFGIIFYHQNPNDLVGISNITGVLFILVTNVSFASLFPVITLFAGEMPLFLREHWNGLYRSDVYFITRNIVELPINLLLPFLFVSINYYMVGLRPESEYFFKAVGIMILTANVAISYGYLISCMAKDYNNAVLLSTPMTLPLMFFGGFYIQIESIPVYMNWLKYLSWFMYGFEDLSVNQWDGFTSNLRNGTVEVPIGYFVLNKLGFEADNFTINLWSLFTLLIVFRIMAYLLLLLKTFRKT